MLSYQKGVVKTSVRHLVEFLFRGGDITTGSSVSVSPEAMLEGSRLHRKIQRGQKATYQSEVPLKMEWQEEGYDLVLEGRADGIDKTEVNKDRLSDVDGMNQTESDEEKLQHVIGMNQIESNEEKLTYVDEIKCVYRDVEEIEEADILHLAQAKCYAYMYGVKQDLEKIGVQITYCHLETEQIKRIFYCYTMGELSLWFAEVLDAYRMWAAYYVEAREKRDASIQALQFPFSFRPGQKKMTAIAYQAMENKKHRSWKNDFYALSCPKRTWSRKSRKYFLSHGKDNYKDSGGGYDKAAKKAGIISLSSNDYGKGKNLYSGRDAV